MKRNKMMLSLICGLLGCLFFGASDWLMIYGDPTYFGEIWWLTEGVRNIPQWRFDLAMALSLPGIILYGVALFSVQNYIRDERPRRIYHYLNAFGLTPWLALHLFYIMILSLYSATGDLAAATGLFTRQHWIVLASEILMLPVFIYWFFLQLSGKTVFPKRYAITNVLVFYGVLKLVSEALPTSAFRNGFINGLMSESMILWFGVMLIWEIRKGADRNGSGL